MAISIAKKGAASKKASVPRSTAIAASRATTIAYVAPALIGMLLFNVYPVLYTAYMSITDRNGPRRFAEGKYTINGIGNTNSLFDNFTRILGEPDFYLVVGRTLIYTVFCVALFFAVGLMFAIILNHKAIQFKGMWRTLMILPWAVPTFVTALIWKFLFHAQFGPINQTLALIGIQGPQWLNNGFTAFAAIIIVNLWMSFPYFMLVLLGGLQSVPNDVYEASAMDGAGFWRQLFTITLPLLRPVAVPAIILSAIQTFGSLHFGTIRLLTDGGPILRANQPGATELLLVWAYHQGFNSAKLYGVVGALAVIIFVIMLVATLAASRITNATKAAYE